jgi:Centromere protein Scm3
MEPPLKRLRLFEPDESGPSITYDSDNYSDLYDDEDTALEAGEDDDEDEDVEQGDPDLQLEQTRAQLDLKLKSKFEAIFEKYGRDFTGIGDEIDLRTGEIVVDNGHLLEMEDERDDGTGRPSILEAFTQEPDETFGSTEADDDDTDEVHESHVKLEDMEEDDMILFQNSGVSSGRPETPPSRSGLVQDLLSDQREGDKKVAASKSSYPSECEILAQFGQELGPKIVRYVSQQRAQDDSNIEPAWRTPGLPLATPGKRPILKSILLQPDTDRSPSPKGSTSVWAPKMPRGRPRRDGADVAALFRGETIIRDRTWYSSGYVSTTVTKQRTERIAQSQSKRTMSVPLNETLATGKSKLELSPWAHSKQTDSSDIYGSIGISDEEPDSSEEKVAKFYKPRRSWSNPGFLPERRTSGNMNLQPSQPRHKRKDDPSSKGGRAPKVRFTEADDEALLEWVKEALQKGFALWSPTHWKKLAEKVS